MKQLVNFLRKKEIFFLIEFFLGRQKSKFIYSMLRREIPEQYNVEIEIPENKHKCYMEFTDGSIQI
jgi:hypothetical protein